MVQSVMHVEAVVFMFIRFLAAPTARYSG